MSNPVKPNLKTELIPASFILVSLITSFYFYALFPEQVATHWNAWGEVDAYSSKVFTAFFFPLFNLAIYLLLLFIPYLDPQKTNYNKFKNIYHIIKTGVIVFMSLLYFIIGFNGLGYDLPVNIIVPIGVGLFFILIGFYLKDIKPNWFLGIRTPWTLSSPYVWQKTHQYGSKVFIISGLTILLAVIFPSWLIYFIILFIVLILSTIIYSYLIYRK